MTRAEQLYEALAAAGKANGGKLTREQWLTAVTAFFAAEKPKAKRQMVSAADAIAELQAEPVYSRLDVKQQYDLCRIWCRNNGLPEPSRKRLTNWLNKALKDAPLVRASTPAPAVVHLEEPRLWREIIAQKYPELVFLNPNSPCYWDSWATMTRHDKERAMRILNGGQP